MIANLSIEDLTAIFEGEEGNQLARTYPFYPLTSPGMPPAGVNFIAHAAALGDCSPLVFEGKGKAKTLASVGWQLKCLYLRALYSDDFAIPIRIKGQTEIAPIVPGHVWGLAATGPKYLSDEELQGRPRVMIIGKMPGQEEVQAKRNFVGPAGEMLRETFEKHGVEWSEMADWYVCNVVRWPHITHGAMPQAWVKDCLLLLHQELRLYRPDYILCLGAESTKAILGDQGCTVSNMIGRYTEFEYPVYEPGDEPATHTCKVMAVTHPQGVLRTTEKFPQYSATVRNFVQLIRGREFAASSDESITIQCMRKERDLRELVDHIISQPGLKKIGVDGEWHGQHPGEPGSYLRTIQISHHGEYAAVIVLRDQGGEPTFCPSISAAIGQLTRLLDRDDVQIGGSFFSADLPWLEYNGLHIAHRFTVPATVEELNGGNYPGGFDVGIAYHSHNETGDFKLEVMGSRLCGADRWDLALQEWKRDYLKANKMKDEELEGYGECPEEVLFPYGGKDAAYTRQLMEINCPLLDSDRFGNSSWVPFHISMLAFQAFNEMGTVGVKIDQDRIDALTDLFQDVRGRLMAELRAFANWPTFNPRSPQQCVEYLFGTRFSTKIDKDTGERLRVRPSGALSLALLPVKTTGRGKPWGWVAARGEEDKWSPSTDKEVCGILGLHSEGAKRLRDVRLIDQVLKSVFRPPTMKGNELVLKDDGRRTYGGGIAKYVTHDSRVRSSFSQVKETGRASSARPPLQNISKRREGDYAKIIGADNYPWPVRSFITSNTDPNYGELTVLLEADYTGAELFGVAAMSRDAQMLDHCQRANLPDGDPNQYDIHSNIAVTSFNLDCPATKKGLNSIGQVGKRVSAKNIIFGVNYGRSAESCARQCKEEGNEITVGEAEQIIQTIFETYPGIPQLQEALRARVDKPGWIRSCFGRYRRFIATSDRGAMGELERQALNFPFQSMVADAVSLALNHLNNHPRKAELGYKIVLQIHDAIVLEVPLRSLDIVYDEIMPDCMAQRVTFKACDLDGIPFADSPTYRFGLDQDVVTRWGVGLTVDDCEALGIDPKYKG